MASWFRILQAEGPDASTKYIELCVACVLPDCLEAFGGEDWSPKTMIKIMRWLQKKAATQDFGDQKGRILAAIYSRFFFNLSHDSEELTWEDILNYLGETRGLHNRDNEHERFERYAKDLQKYADRPEKLPNWYKKTVNYKYKIKAKLADTTAVIRKTRSLILLLIINRTLETVFSALLGALPRKEVVSSSRIFMPQAAVDLIRDVVLDIRHLLPSIYPKIMSVRANTYFPLFQPFSMDGWTPREIAILLEHWALLMNGTYTSLREWVLRVQAALDQWRSEQRIPALRMRRSVEAIHDYRKRLNLVYRIRTCSSRSYDNMKVTINGKETLVRNIVNSKAQRLVGEHTRAQSKATTGEIARTLMTSLAGSPLKLSMDYYDAYLTIHHYERGGGGARAARGNDKELDQFQMATADEYAHWISIITDAADTDPRTLLAKGIYQEDPTRWPSPVSCGGFLLGLTAHGRLLNDPTKTRFGLDDEASFRVDIIAAMTYRKDHVCPLNVRRLDFLAIHQAQKGLLLALADEQWAPDEVKDVINGIITAYVNPDEIRRWDPRSHKAKKNMGYYGTICIPQAKRAFVNMLLDKYPEGYFYGKPKDETQVNSKLGTLLPLRLRAELNQQFEAAGNLESLSSEARRAWVVKKFNELRGPIGMTFGPSFQAE